MVKDVATNKKIRVCVTIKKRSVNKLPNIQIRLFTAMENEELKQVAFVNYTLNEFKKCPKFRENLCFLRTVMYNKLCYSCFLSLIIIVSLIIAS